jgi:hypothetical protein
MKTVKIIEGKAFMCEEIAPNGAHCEVTPITWDIYYLIGAVTTRMRQCLEELESAVKNNNVFKVEENLIHHASGIFVIPSYEAMQSLLQKLEEERECSHSRCVDTTWLEIKLTAEEADQRFKAYVATTDHFGIYEMRLLDVVIDLRRRGVGDPSKTVLRTHRKPE